MIHVQKKIIKLTQKTLGKIGAKPTEQLVQLTLYETLLLQLMKEWME